MSEEVVRYGHAEGVATITLARPEARNAVNLAMCDAILAATRRATAEEARLVVIRAEGPIFCAGADLKERKGMSENDVRARRVRAFAAYDSIERLPMPSLAVVEGPAIGSGVEIAAGCDMILATPTASFRTPEALWGTVGATQRLPRILGKRLAKDLMFTGRTLTAEEAREGGLVTRLVQPAALEGALAEIAAVITRSPPHAMRIAKRCVDQGLELDPRGALATEMLAIEEILAGDWRAGVAGFGAKP